MYQLARGLNGLMVLILSAILLGAYGVQFLYHEEPCPLCLLQRLGMIGVACGALLNLRFGIRPSHYAICLFSALFGGVVALRQISLHVCPGSPQFGFPVLGMSLYTWSFFVFASVVLGVAILLTLYNPKEMEKEPQKLGLFEKFVFGLLLSIASANILTTWMQCGFGPCQG